MLVRYGRHFTSSWFSEKCNNLQIQINNESTIKSGYWSCWRACTLISTNHYFSQKYTNCNQTYSRFRWCLMKVTKILGIFLERLSFYHPKNSTDKEIKVIFKRWLCCIPNCFNNSRINKEYSFYLISSNLE